MAANCTPGATSAVYDCLVIVIDIVVFIAMKQYLKLKFLVAESSVWGSYKVRHFLVLKIQGCRGRYG